MPIAGVVIASEYGISSNDVVGNGCICYDVHCRVGYDEGSAASGSDNECWTLFVEIMMLMMPSDFPL
jgi:hypothetical protein